MCDQCDCAHVPDHGACDVFEQGMNGRCVYCDHDEGCHPGQGPLHNGPLAPVLRNEGQELQDLVFCYLDALRESGVINMIQAGPYLQAEFGFGKREARDWLLRWIKTRSGKRHVQ